MHNEVGTCTEIIASSVRFDAVPFSCTENICPGVPSLSGERRVLYTEFSFYGSENTIGTYHKNVI